MITRLWCCRPTADVVWSKKPYFLLQKYLGFLFCEKWKNSLAPQWYEIPTKAIYWHVFKNLTHMLLVLHWALSNCLRPLWDSFHAFKIKITYIPYILMLTSRLEVTQKNMDAIHTKILHRFNMILHIAKGIWDMRKKKKKYPCPEAWEKENEKGKER